jgi:hypothetical protein
VGLEFDRGLLCYFILFPLKSGNQIEELNFLFMFSFSQRQDSGKVSLISLPLLECRKRKEH